MSRVISPSYSVKVDLSQHSLWKDRGPLLERIDLELTERCNNNCVHCNINLPMGSVRARQRELTTDRVKDILSEAAALGILTVRFTGGEPLLRKDFEELYGFARRLGVKVLLFTNARLITPRLADLWTRIPPLEKIEVSVYGMQEDSYDAAVRVHGAFAEFHRGVDLLRERRIPFVVKGPILPQTGRELDAFEAWAATIPAMDQPPVLSMFFDLRSRRDSPARNRLIQTLRVSPDDGVKVLTRRRSAYRKEMRQFCTKFMGPTGDRLFSCGAGQNPCVDAYGMLQPCLLLRHPALVYNVKKGSLKDALTNFFPGVREIRASDPEYLARCARCFLKGFCEQCPAKSWAEHGTLDTPVEYFCQVAHAQARELRLLREQERAWEVADWKARLEQI